MDELEQLKKFRAELPPPDPERASRVRAALDEAVDEERRPAPVEASTATLGQRRALVGGMVAAVLTVVLALAVFLPSNGDDDLDGQASLREVAAGLQTFTHLDFDPLDALGLTLRDVAANADVVGIGRIVDIRLAYTDGSADEVQHMFLVVEPARLAAGADLLGESGEVLVDQIAPPIDRETGSRGIGELREAAIESPERVAFMLSVGRPEGNPPDLYAGRAEDDPLLRPTHPSSFFALDEQAEVAFPLTTDENVESVNGNVGALRELGAKIDHFSEGEGQG